MNRMQMIATILVLALAVMITRFLPFLIFKESSKLPQSIEYLGKVLPSAMMGLLVVYCLKDYDFSSSSEILPALLAIAVVAALHVIKRNMILSIALGTIAYMFLIRLF